MTTGLSVIVEWLNGTTIYHNCDFSFSKEKQKYYIFKKLGKAKREVVTRWKKTAVKDIQRVPSEQIQILKQKPTYEEIAEEEVNEKATADK